MKTDVKIGKQPGTNVADQASVEPTGQRMDDKVLGIRPSLDENVTLDQIVGKVREDSSHDPQAYLDQVHVPNGGE